MGSLPSSALAVVTAFLVVLSRSGVAMVGSLAHSTPVAGGMVLAASAVLRSTVPLVVALSAILLVMSRSVVARRASTMHISLVRLTTYKYSSSIISTVDTFRSDDEALRELYSTYSTVEWQMPRREVQEVSSSF